MHYYQFNIGDYSSHTSRLSLIEDLAYRRLLDLYYLTERPFNGCSTDVARDIGLQDYQKEVDYILAKFFPKDGENWVNSRCKKEIESYQSKKATASKAGKASAEARKNKASKHPFNDRSTTVQPNINQEPINNKHKTVTNKEWTPPEGLNLEAWELFTAHRKEIKKPLKTDRTKTGQANKLKDLTPDQQMAVVNLSCDEGWVGLFPEKITAPQTKSFQPYQQNGSEFRPLVCDKTESTPPPAGLIEQLRKQL